MVEVKLSTKKGTRIYEMGMRCNAFRLSEIYKSYSHQKLMAYNWCMGEFLKSGNGTNFGIGNANTFGFTASWDDIIDGELVMRVETKDNSYLVWLER